MKNNFKKNKGITLIALIITIVVLLILAVVTIRAVNEESIFAHANNAATRYNAVATEENSTISNYLTEIRKYDKEQEDGDEPQINEHGFYENMVYVQSNEWYTIYYLFNVNSYKAKRVPTETGLEMGISSATKTGTYQVVNNPTYLLKNGNEVNIVGKVIEVTEGVPELKIAGNEEGDLYITVYTRNEGQLTYIQANETEDSKLSVDASLSIEEIFGS